jgi:2,4-dienoyl-CoA reductase-like NADH-dependent reductase (Old Yellow Enzyme family)
MSSDPLLQPLTIKHLTLKNRIMSTSHAISYGEDAMPKERYQLYHEEKAKGGIGLTMFGGSSNVSPDSGSVFGQLSVGDDRIIPHFRKFGERVHRHGAAIMCQITHLGGRSHWRSDNWLPTVSPSRSSSAMLPGAAGRAASTAASSISTAIWSASSGTRWSTAAPTSSAARSITGPGSA